MAEKERDVLLRHLNKAGTFTRLPTQLRRSFKATIEQKLDATDRIFLEAGFQAWTGYTLTTNAVEGTSHFLGKPDDAKVVSRLRKRTYEETKDIATVLNGQKLDSEAENRVKAWEEQCGYARWQESERARNSAVPTDIAGQESAHATDCTSEAPTDIAGQEGRRAATEGDSVDSTMTDSPAAVPSQENPAPADPQQSENQEYEAQLAPSSVPVQGAAIQHDSLMAAETALVQNFQRATIMGTMDVFSPYLCGAIIKDYIHGAAMVQMAFPHHPQDDCLMTLNIQPNKIEYLAMALFGIHLETEEDQRYLVLPTGSRVVPLSDMSLEGAGEAAVADVLGEPISTSIQGSWKRMIEVGSAVRTTKCVTMQISTKPSAPALLNLWLGLRKAIELRAKLYS